MATVHRIIHENLNMCKTCAKFVLRVVTDEQKEKRLVTAGRFLMGNKTVPHSPYSPDIAPCDFWPFSKMKENLRGSRFEDIEKMTEVATRVLDTFILDGAFEKWRWSVRTNDPILKKIRDLHFFEINKGFS